MLGSARYLLGVVEIAPARRLRRRSGPRPSAGASPDFAGAPGSLATSVLALALLIWAAEVLGTFGAFEAAALSAGAVVGVGLWTLLRRVARVEGGRERTLARPQAPLEPWQDPPAGVSTSCPDRLRHRASRSDSFRGRCSDSPRHRDDRVRFAPGTTGRSRPGSSRAGTPGTCTSSRRSSWPGSTRRTRKSSTPSGCWPSVATSSRRC